jgi:protein-tyrosine phosphatase
MIRIQFVCLGNICRSPAAEGVMRRIVEERDLGNQIKIDSAGTAGYHIGHLPDKRMIAAARARGIELESRAKKYEPRYLSERTLVIAMDRDNLENIMRLRSESEPQPKLFSDYLDDTWPTDVPDPYYGEQSGFDYVLDMLSAGCPKILDQVLFAKEGH